MDIRTDPVLFGRADALTDLLRNLRMGRHTLLLGSKGIGKTRLMQEAMDAFQGRAVLPSQDPPRPGELAFRISAHQYRVMAVSQVSPLGSCLREMVLALHAASCLWLDASGPANGDMAAVRKKAAALGTVGVQDAILLSLRQSRPGWLIFFDSFDRVSASHQPLLEKLLHCAVLCGAAVSLKEVSAFKKIWSSFVPLNLEPLTARDGERLIGYFLCRYPVPVSDPRLYTQEILKAAGGNPFHIRNMLWMGSRESRLGREEIRRLRWREEGELFNMGPVYILGASILTLSKIFSFGTDNREFYIYFSALGFLVYLVFRVYRTFFLYRPQRRK